MRLFGVRALRIALVAALCCFGAAAGWAASGRLTIMSGGLKRSAFVVEHARLKRSLRPVIVVLHGQSGAGLRVRRYLGVESALRSQAVVTVYPDAIGGHWALEGAGGERDRRFILDLIAKLVADGVADRRRVYVVGVATGAMVAMQLACGDAGTFAGAAALIGLMSKAEAATCKPSRPIPFLLMAGTADPLEPFGGGKAGLKEFHGEVASAEATVAPFARAAACGPKKTRIDLPDRDRNDGSRVQIEVYGGCKTPIELVKIEGGGHTLPGRRRKFERGKPLGAHNGDVEAARMVLDFFRRARGG
ncbi:MAG: phospholipase [Methylobacteriaceae bacterium]|nr:phospholipase [Methylobacteriaceae bacterium]